MRLFGQRAEVQRFDTMKAFAEEFSIGKGDFLLVSKSIYKKYIERLGLTAEVHFKSEYGEGEPTDVMIDGLLADFRKTGCERIVAIGGGAVIDMAKILLLDTDAQTADIFQGKVCFRRAHSLIAVPTTCGAGSESSNVSIAEITKLHTKMGIAVNEIYPDYAVLIPELLAELPYPFFVTSAIDALIHAIESFVSPKANLYTEMFSEKAMEMILSGFRQLAENGADYRMELLEEFLTASDLAGIAFGNAGTGTVHAMSYPLSGVYHVTHGEANYQFLTAVFKMYQEKQPVGKIQRLNQFLAGVLLCEEDKVYEVMEELLSAMIARKPLREYGMKKEEIKSFAESVEKSQQRLLNQSYVKFDVETMMRIYQELY